MRCIKCGSQLPPNAKYCDECGAKQTESVVCSECGTVLEADVNYCPKCGTPVKMEELTPEMIEMIEKTLTPEIVEKIHSGAYKSEEEFISSPEIQEIMAKMCIENVIRKFKEK